MKLRIVLAAAIMGFVAPVAVPAQPAAEAPAATAPKVAWTKTIQRAPESYLQLEDVVGVHKSLLDYLGLKEGDPIVMKAGEKVMAANTVLHEKEPTMVYLKGTMRTTLGVNDGAVPLQITAATWSGEAPSKEPVSITTVTKPPEAFASKRGAIGLSYADMTKLRAKPGMRAVVTAGDKRSIGTVYLQDRGEGNMLMSKVGRDRLGIVDGPVTGVKIQVVPGSSSSSESEPE